MARSSIVGISDGTMSDKDFRTLMRRCPPYLRAALKRFKRAVDDAEAASEGRWQQHNRDIEARHKLKANVLNAEYDLREAATDQRAAMEAALTDARDELAQHEADVADRANRERERQARDESSFFLKARNFVIKNHNATFTERVASMPSGDPARNLVKVRAKIREATDAIDNIDIAPLPFNDVMEKVDRELCAIAAEGAPGTFGVTRFAKLFGENRRQGNLEWRNDYVASEFFPSGFKLCVWALKDVIRDKIAAEVRTRIAASAFEPIAIADREPRKDAIRAELLELERTEEALVHALRESGDANVSRRHDADIRAVLGVEIVGKEKQKHTGPGSLPIYEPPTMTTPQNQTMPRSEWLSKSH